ncbi:MAG: TetR/AcrR family transcriptional regulator [Actinomycetota bacterium]|nr:TetR/AcrR family transcriptional regulator [Actinomycetota bacterium]
MVSVRNTRQDVIEAAGRLFAEKGYHGTSMRDLGRELGLLGSSLYAHVESKQDLLVEVVEEGARLFQASAAAAAAAGGSSDERLRRLIAGHIQVVLENRDVVRTYLNEARMLDTEHRSRVIAARDAYEQAFRQVIGAGASDATFRPDLDPKLSSIFILSILNALERWYRSDGAVDGRQLVDEVTEFALAGVRR